MRVGIHAFLCREHHTKIKRLLRDKVPAGVKDNLVENLEGFLCDVEECGNEAESEIYVWMTIS